MVFSVEEACLRQSCREGAQREWLSISSLSVYYFLWKDVCVLQAEPRLDHIVVKATLLQQIYLIEENAT